MFKKQITRRDALIQTAAVLPAAYASSVRAAAAQERPNAQQPTDWPMTNGPYGNFNPRQYGHRLIDNLAQARLLWRSQDNDAGFAKGSVSGYIRLLAQRTAHPGSCSGPIVARGKVYCSSFRPAGQVWAENQPQLRNLPQPYRGRELQHLQRQMRIDADDLLIAFDQRTGRTAWKAVEEGKGLNRYMGKREGFGVAPAFFDGKVFSMGSTGRLYAYNAADGRKLWETNIGRAHRSAEELKRNCLQRKILPGNLGWNASLVIADGVLVVPLFNGGRDMGIRGVNVQNGRTLWEAANVTCKYATPSLFHHRNRQYLLVANCSGELRMIDPRTGRTLWTERGLGPNHFPLAPSPNHVIVRVNSHTMEPRRNIPWGLMAAYRISPRGAERAWTMPDRREFWHVAHMDSCARRQVLIRDGNVYYYLQNKGANPARLSRLHILNETTGAILHTDRNVTGDHLMYLIEDRLLHWTDACHGDRARLELFTADPARFRRLCQPWNPPQQTTTAYEVYLETPYVDGCLYLRTITGEIRCYDLRRRG